MASWLGSGASAGGWKEASSPDAWLAAGGLEARQVADSGVFRLGSFLGLGFLEMIEYHLGLFLGLGTFLEMPFFLFFSTKISSSFSSSFFFL